MNSRWFFLAKTAIIYHQKGYMTEPGNMQLSIDEPAVSNDRTRALIAPFGAGLYIMFTLLAAVCTYLYTLRQESILTCPGTGYGSDSYLAYCFADQYGDYDHGALWFGLEPRARASAANAEVLFLGNSRLQFGFASDAMTQWFSASSASYFLMGFAYWENYRFEAPLLQRIKPRAKVYVINLDMFFENTVNGPADSVMHDADAFAHYRRKRLWQTPHRLLCTRIPSICGNTQSFYRSNVTGAYTRFGGWIRPSAVSYSSSVDQDKVTEYRQRGEAFFASLPVDRQCVLLTLVPSTTTDMGTAKALAAAFGLTLIAPQIGGLTTFDGSHMDRPSAERWSQAFLQEAGPAIQQCLHGNTSPGT
jgi:hypothetical protein